MNIAIITITAGQNYGNRLQNYALQEVLTDMGNHVETIWNNAGAIENMGFVDSVKCFIKKTFKIKYTPRVERIIKFNNFNRKLIHWSDFSVDLEKIPKDLKNKYDIFICGSDQIWNPYYKRTSNIDFLGFVNPNQRISYAASFGVDSIPEEKKELFKNYLKDFHSISMREKSGARLVEELIHKNVQVVLDPTMLLSSKKWEKIEKRPKNMKDNEKYLLSYFLDKSDESQKTVKKLANIDNLSIIQLEDCYSTGLHNPIFFSMDPSEFLWLINHATYICTDSFHACVFSILFKKPFTVFQRNNKLKMSTRIDQLLQVFSLQNRTQKNIKQYDSSIYNIDYSNCEFILEKERKASLDFIKASLEN